MIKDNSLRNKKLLYRGVDFYATANVHAGRANCEYPLLRKYEEAGATLVIHIFQCRQAVMAASGILFQNTYLVQSTGYI